MGVPPYEKAAGDTAATAKLQQQYAALLTDITIPAGRLPTEGVGVATTTFMLETRALGPADRKARYIEERLEDQRRWYRTRAAKNERAANLWMTFISALQLLGLIVVGMTLAGGLPFSPFGLLGAVIAGSAAWLQLRRHQELSDAYRAATVDLDRIAAVAAGVTDEDELQKFVEDAEDAMSREHTVWRAKRSVLH
jgi:hypothetical protein